MRVYPCLSYHKFKHIQMDVLSLSTASNPSGELVSLNRFEKQVMCSVHQLDTEIISHHATMFSKKTDVKNHGKNHQQPFPWFPQSFVSRSLHPHHFRHLRICCWKRRGGTWHHSTTFGSRSPLNSFSRRFQTCFFCGFKLQ